MNKAALIFDVDGTLWDSTVEVTASWNEILKEHQHEGFLTPEAFRGVMGLPMSAIGEKLFPSPTFSPQEREELLSTCMDYETKYLLTHPGQLYPLEKETLEELQKHYLLLIVSNCQKGYIESLLKGCHLTSFFADYICWGDNKLNKHENITLLIKRHHLSKALYIGDTIMDQKETALAGIPFIHAAYGFGKVEGVVPTIRCFHDLLEVVPKVIKE